MVRSMISLTILSLSFWDYAIEFVVRILNMVPTKKVDKTPYELWHEKVPNLSYLKVWGCEAHVKRHTPDKLQQRSVKQTPGSSSEPEHFGDDALPRPPGLQRIAKSQRSGSNSTASSGSNSMMYQEFMKEQYELDRKAKNASDRARERRAKAVNPCSKDCGGDESATNRHTRDGSGRRHYH
ncbi:retrotransposon protein, putative, ty1-copia subclass [Tanacetum coccineum]